MADLHEQRFGRRLLPIPSGADLPEPGTKQALNELGRRDTTGETAASRAAERFG